MDFITVISRLALTFILSFIFGFERQKSHKPIGFGTFIFVAMGASSLAIVALTISPENPLPLLSSVVSGIGFLGAGALLKTTDRIFGFTSAATIWLFAIFGLVIGVGEILIGVYIYAAIWGVMLFDNQLEMRGIGSYQKKLTIKTNKVINEKLVRNILVSEARKFRLLSSEIDKNLMILTYEIEATKDHLNKLPQLFYKEPWFGSCRIE